jgi:RNA polymerase sigma factor (sigma-70 family)
MIIENYLKHKFSKYRDLEDDVSEILIKIYINLSKFDNTKSKFNSWCLSIANNHMIDKWRDSSISSTYISKKNTTTISEDINDLTNYFNKNYNTSSNIDVENLSSINYVTSQLSEYDYNLLNMKYIQGYNYSEIGKEFNITSTTASNKINYIKSKLKKNNKEIIFD